VPATQYLPVGQGRHADMAAPFATGLYVPAAQSISSPSGQYLPALQLPQLPRAGALAALNVPGGHLMGAGDARGQYEPAGQLVQGVALAPSSPRNVPTAQSVGAAIPASGQRVPGGHGIHSDGFVAAAFSLYVPGRHFVSFSAPLLENDPGSVFLQCICDAFPDSLLKVPASQNIGRGDPIGQYEPFGQILQSDEVWLPYLPEYVPSGQRVQREADVWSE